MQITDTYLAYQFLKRLNTPFTNWDAFHLGVIDANGHVLIKRHQLTPQQQKAWGRFDVLVANLKSLLAKLPGGNTKLASLAATVILLKESDLDENDVDTLREHLDTQVVAMKEYLNQLPSNNLLQAAGLDEAVKYKKLSDDLWSVHTDGKLIGHMTQPSIDVNQGKGKGTKASKRFDYHHGTTPPKKNIWGYDSSKNRFLTKDGLTRHVQHLNEDAPISNVGGGAIAGAGVGPQGEPGVKQPGKKRKLGELPTKSLFTRKSHG